jgi:4-nitrophenyl phosphatase
MDREVTWKKMEEAAYAIEGGAIFIGTNADPSFPTERGFAPGNGAILQALQVTTGVQPITVGKPEPYLFFQALELLGTSANQTLVLGDRLSTDILGGIKAGLVTALLLTGVTSGYDLQNSDCKPDFVFQDLNELIRSLWKDSF